NGPLTIGNSATVDAGLGAVTLTAASAGNDNPLTIASAANVQGLGGVTLIADNMAINGTVDAGTARATLHQFENGTAIDLGGSDSAGTLGLSDAELDQITAGTLQIGDANSGDVTITAAITPAHLLAPSGTPHDTTSALSIRSGGSITEVGLGSIQVANICLVTDASKLGKTVSLLGQNDFDNVAASGLHIN